VVTRRREKINSDEEERTRIGYQIQTGFKFNAGHQQLASHQAELEFSDDEGQRLPVAKLTYASNAEIWRVNLGWRNRSTPAEQGFLINSEKGTWISKSRAESDRNNGPEVGSNSVQRVIPYVHDRRNCLLFQPEQPDDEIVARDKTGLESGWLKDKSLPIWIIYWNQRCQQKRLSKTWKPD